MQNRPLTTVDEELAGKEFERFHEQLAMRLEKQVAQIGGAFAAFGSLLVATGHFLTDAIPIELLGVTLTFLLWYTAVSIAMREGFYRPWIRYVSSILDVTLASVVIAIDTKQRGAIFAIGGGGPALYSLAVAAAMLRLDPRLSLFSGANAAIQYMAMMVFVVQPVVDFSPSPVDPSILLLKSGFLFTGGLFGRVATKSMQKLLARVKSTTIERERVRGLFGVYVSEEIVDHLLEGANPDGGERRTVTVLFSDIRGFTSFSETRKPEEVVRLLNIYFENMCRIVGKHGGVVNKFLGDGMLVVFGAPQAMEHDARAAIAAAQEMVTVANRMAADKTFEGLKIGVGIHRGEVVAGNVGGSQRQEYTVIGDTVNTASRVETLTKQLSRSVLVTKAVRDAAGATTFESMGSQSVKGREGALEIFALPEVA